MSNSILVKFKVLLPLITAIISGLYFFIKYQKNSLGTLLLYFNTLMILITFSEIPVSIKKYKINKKVQKLIDYSFTVYEAYNPPVTTPDSL